MKCSICGQELEPDGVQAEQYNAKCPKCKSKIRAKRNALKHEGIKAKER